MIEIKNVNKKFNKGKNKIKAVDDASLKLPKEGLVALLGPSGCGKTTLLNLIGGLDNVNKGKIFINGKNITSKFVFKKDKIRNNNIGYIFQDYKLVNYMTVYENVELVLKMIGVKNKKEREKRVLFVLDKVGMLRYKRRPCSMLSGGERQRVAIARALVKNPDIILADEPTGNLDSKNSLEIMKIISSIAKDRLVILVTHEKTLANFYATRIIEIVDGSIKSDQLNKEISDLDYIIENRVYLQDFNNNSKIEEKNININVYKNKEDKIDFDLIVKNGNVYIKSSSKVEVIDENSSLEVIDDKYKKISKEELDKYSFDMNSIITNNEKKYSSIFNPITLMLNGFKKVFKYSLIKKILLFGFFISAMFTTFAISSYLGVRKVDENLFMRYDRNYLLASAKISSSDYDDLINRDDVNLVLPVQSIQNTYLKLNTFYQINSSTSITGSISSLDLVEKDNLYAGTFPENYNEVIVDKKSLDKLLEKEDVIMSGINSVEDFIGQSLVIYSGSEYIDYYNYKITGVYDGDTLAIYFNETAIPNFIISDIGNNTQLLSYESLNNMNLTEGYLPINDNEIVIHTSNKEINKMYSEIEIDSKKYKVVGYYDNHEYMYNYLTNNSTLYDYLFDNSNGVSIHASDKDSVKQYLQTLNINAKDSYEMSESEFIKSRIDFINIITIVSVITLSISLIQIFIIMRSSFLSRIKEVGVYRAIGVKKSDIYKMFYGEIFVITLLITIPGVLTMAYVLNNISLLESFVTINSFVVLGSIILLFMANLIIGLLPVYNTIKKSPAYILSRTDIE